jgi:hypothetical protein
MQPFLGCVAKIAKGTSLHDGGEFGRCSHSLDSSSDSAYDKQPIPATPFKQRGFVWPFTCSCLCSCSWSASSAFWRGSGVLTGSRIAPSSARGKAKRSTLHRLLSPRTPDDCPACRLAPTPSSGGEPASAPVRPWREVKSRRGAPKRINTAGFACPNPQCRYFGNTDAQIHALVGDGKHGQAEQIQTFRCQACRTTFTSRRNTPLYGLKPPSQEVAVVRISRWLKGWTLRPPREFSATVRPPSRHGSRVQAGTHRPCTSASSTTSSSLTCNWMNCAPGCAAPKRCSGCGWLSILAPRFCPCCIWVRVHNMRRTCSSTPCNSSWRPTASRCSPVMAYMCTFML